MSDLGIVKYTCEKRFETCTLLPYMTELIVQLSSYNLFLSGDPVSACGSTCTQTSGTKIGRA